MSWESILKRSKRQAAVMQIRDSIAEAKRRLQKKYLPEEDYKLALTYIEDLENHLKFFSKPKEFPLEGETKYVKEEYVNSFLELFKDDLEKFYKLLEGRSE